MAGVLYVTQFGAAGDGVTDDTDAVQAALNGLTTGQALLLETGGVYSVTNLTLPYDPDYGDQAGRKSIVGPGAVIKARAGGDSTYMITDQRWLDQNLTGGSPWEFNGVSFHGNDLVDHTFINYGYARWFRDCVFEGGLVTCCLFTRYTEDGTECTPFFAGNYWRGCYFRSGALTSGALFKTDGPTINGPTDGYLLGCEFNGRAIVPYCLDMRTVSGWTIADCQGYASFAGASSDLRIRNFGRPAAIHGNTFEEGALIENIGGRLARLGPGNHWRSDVTVNFTDDDSAEDIAFVGDHFGENRNADVNATLIHNSARLNKLIHALVCTAEAAAPFVENHPTTFPRLRYRSCIAKDVTGYLHDLPDNVNVNVLMPKGTGSAPEMATFQTDEPGAGIAFVHDGVAQFESIGFLNWRDTAGNTYARIGALTLVVTPGAAEGRLYFYTYDSGVQAEQLRLGDGVLVGASATGGLKGVGTVNADVGLYVDGVSALVSTGTKTTAGAPYTNDGYITVTLADGTTRKVMTTA